MDAIENTRANRVSRVGAERVWSEVKMVRSPERERIQPSAGVGSVSGDHLKGQRGRLEMTLQVLVPDLWRSGALRAVPHQCHWHH